MPCQGKDRGFESHTPLQEIMKILTYWRVDYYEWYNGIKASDHVSNVEVVAKTKEKAEQLAHQYLTNTNPLYNRLIRGEWTRIERIVLVDEEIPYTHYDPDDLARVG